MGIGRQQVFLLNVLACTATLLAVFRAGSAGGATSGAFWAAIFWALISVTPLLEANQPNTEAFINAFLSPAFALLITSPPCRMGVRRAVVIGTLLFAASLFKHAIVIIPLFWAVGYVAMAWGDRQRQLNAVKDFGVIAGVGAIGWGIVFLYFTATGRAGDFFDAVFVFNSYYAENPLRNLVNGFSLHALFPVFFRHVIPFYVFFALAVWIGFRRGNRDACILLLSYAVGAQVTLALFGEGRVTLAVGGARPEVGNGYPHYYQILLPALVIGAGWLPGFWEKFQGKFSKWLSPVSGTSLVVYLAVTLFPFFARSHDEWSRLKYGDVFVDEDAYAGALDKLLLPDEAFYVWGAESNLHYSSRRRPLSGGVFSFYGMLAGPLVERLTAKTLADLNSSKPDLLVIYKPSFNQTQIRHPVLQWFFGSYEPIPATLEKGNYALFVKKNSALAQRLKSHQAAGD